MAYLAEALQRFIPISQFNQGQASKIFERLQREKELVVLNNNQPSAILLSPEEYERLVEVEEDYKLLLEANLRLKESENEPTVPMDEVLSHLGICESELIAIGDVDGKRKA